MIGIIALCLSATAWADTFTGTVNKSAGGGTSTTASTTSTTDDCVILKGTSLGTTVIKACRGSHQTYADDGSLVGTVTKTGGSGGGDPGGKHQNGPVTRVRHILDMGDGSEPVGIPDWLFVTKGDPSFMLPDGTTPTGITFHWYNTITNSEGIYVWANPLATGEIWFYGNDTAGFTLYSYDVHMGVFSMGGKMPQKNPQVMRALP